MHRIKWHCLRVSVPSPAVKSHCCVRKRSDFGPAIQLKCTLHCTQSQAELEHETEDAKEASRQSRMAAGLAASFVGGTCLGCFSPLFNLASNDQVPCCGLHSTVTMSPSLAPTV